MGAAAFSGVGYASAPQSESQAEQWSQHNDRGLDHDPFSTMSEDVPVGFQCFRVVSADVDNDPRMNTDNLLFHRMGAFYAVSISATLLASVSCITLLAVQDRRESWSEYFALIGFSMVFVMNLACVLVITNQYIAVYRLATTAAIGFDMATSYYSNTNIATSRHIASAAFFYSIPVLVASIGFMNVDKLGHGGRMSYPLCTFMVVAALYLLMTIRTHIGIFKEKYQAIKKHEAGIAKHMRNLASK